MNENSGEILTSGEVISSGEIIESGNELETEEVAMTELEKDLTAMDNNAQSGGNLNIMIFTVIICVVFGIILGIVAGRRAANK